MYLFKFSDYLLNYYTINYLTLILHTHIGSYDRF